MQNLSSTMNLLLGCLQYSLDTINKKEFEVLFSEEIDWDIFNSLVKFHKVESLIHNKFNKKTKDYFPESTSTLLETNHRINAAGNLLLSSELVKISGAFKENNIPVLSIKGLSVSNWLYKDTSLRSSGDIDLLIDSNSWGSALTCMKTMGYGMSSISERLVPGSQLSKQFIRTQKDAMFSHKFKNVTVEMHWRLSPNFYVFPLEFDKAWEARTQFDIRGNTIQQFSDEMHAVYLCYHGSKHGWDRLFWLYDVSLLILNHNTNWSLIFEIAKQLKATTSIVLALELASRVFLVPFPDVIKQQGEITKKGRLLSDKILYKILTDSPIETGSGMLSMSKGINWRSCISPLKAPFASEWLHFLTSPSVHDWESIKLPDYLTPLYRILRPFRLIAKGLFGSKS